MITELMIVLIVVGSIMVFVVWNAANNRRKRAEEQRLVEDSAVKLKAELEKTASEVIQRMETQAANLENLLEDADRNRTEFEGRLAELRKLVKRGESQSIEIRDLLRKLDEAGEDVEVLQQKLDSIEMKISTTLTMQMQPTMMHQPMMHQPMMQPTMQPAMQPAMMSQPTMQSAPARQIQSPISPPPPLLRQQHFAPEPPSAFGASPERSKYDETPPDEAGDFAASLKRAMEEDDPKTTMSRRSVPDRPSIVLPSTDKPSNVIEGEPVKIETPRRGAQPSRPAAQRSGSAPTQKMSAPTRRSMTTQRPTPTAQRPTTSQPLRSSTDTPQQAQSTSSASVPPSPQSSADTSATPTMAPNSVRIKNMLLEGKTVEEIARELGMGRGAVELVQEMTRRMLARKKAP